MIPPLSALQAFESVARRGSFAAAAEELHLTPSAISHQLAKLEGLLGSRLLERSFRGVVLTPAGKAYLPKVASALGVLNAATEDLRHGVSDSLYVHCSPSFATLWLMPRISRFAQSHPEVSLVLSASHVHSDFGLGLVDIDIRYGVPTWQSLDVEPIFVEKVQPLASPEFISRHALHAPEDLIALPLIQSIVNVAQWSEWFDRFHPDARPERFALKFDRAMMSLDAAVQSLGVALESTTLGHAYISSGRLRPVFGDDMALEVQGHYMVCPARNAARPHVRKFLNWIRLETQSSSRY